MSEQLELTYGRPSKSNADSVGKAMCEHLSRSTQKWVKGDRIASALGITRRQVRAGRQAMNGIIISGQHGFCLTERATPDEIRHAINDLRSRAAALELEAHMLRCYAHGRIG